MKISVQSMIAAAMLSSIGLATANGQENAAADAEPGFALVELFTSEGCSSCPSADANLVAIKEEAERSGQKILTLSFHVDYWNYLGWQDPYSFAEATKRQRLYSSVHGTSQVYTPQMIVNGTTEFVGSQRAKSKPAIQAALRAKAKASLDLTSELSVNKIQVKWKASGAQPTDLVNIALVQNVAKEKVSAGENSGRNLTHVNVVRQFRVIKVAETDQAVSLDFPSDFKSSDFHVVGYVQSTDDAVIRAAASAKIES